MKSWNTVGDILLDIQKNHNAPRALSTHDGERWVSHSSKQFIEEVKQVALALILLGVQKKDKVGIISLPSARWTIVDYAIMSIGAVSVPIFANISDENFHFEVEQTGLKTVFVGGGVEQWDRIERSRSLFDNVISLDDRAPLKGAVDYKEFLERGKLEDEKHPEKYRKTLLSLKPNDDATIIYTSGSTGVPKGVLHTHYSLTSLLPTDIFNWDLSRDRYLNFLPLAHVFARVLNFIMTSWGIPVYYYNDLKNLSPICQEVKPTVLVVVPRLLERMYDKMSGKVRDSTGIKKWIGTLAFNFALEENKSFLSKLLHPILDRLVYKTLRGALGGDLRVVFSGGAALNPVLYRFYLHAGFPIYEGWGLTESCPITVNYKGHIRVGTVGLPIPGMEVMTSENGELLVRGPMLLKEYYKSPKVTEESFTEDGWFRTGDRGEIEKDGYVKILGRIKELFKTSTGEMVAPVPIEQALSRSPLVDTAVIIADNKKFVSCLIIPDFDAVKNLKQKKGVPHISDDDFLKGSYVKEELNQVVQAVNGQLNNWEKIREWRLIPKPLSIEGGELTPTLKLKRDVLERKYKELVDSIYVDSANQES